MAEYIEREAAIEAIKNERAYVGAFSWEEERAWTLGFHQGITFALSDLSQLPAADVRPVVRGKWVKIRTHDGGVWKSIACSNCKYEPWFSSAEPLYNFCPNCGADMREGQT